MRLTAAATAGPRTTTRPCPSPEQGHFPIHTHLTLTQPFTSFVVDDAAGGRRQAAAGRRQAAPAHAHVDHPVVDAAQWSLDIANAPKRQATPHRSRVTAFDGGHVRVEDDVGDAVDDDTSCERAVLYAGARRCPAVAAPAHVRATAGDGGDGAAAPTAPPTRRHRCR
jgi:hypothetical protein